ncbi:MAG: hypothetical protein HY868_13815 [Chloroflexi bacterium]|nr:hypothetical protein [Chloroflexota bacterium]
MDEIHNSRESSFHRYAADVASYNAQADAIMRANDIPMIDLFTFTRNLGEGVYFDHVHYTDTVRIQQAAFVAGALVQIIRGVE